MIPLPLLIPKKVNVPAADDQEKKLRLFLHIQTMRSMHFREKQEKILMILHMYGKHFGHFVLRSPRVILQTIKLHPFQIYPSLV